MLSEVWRKCFCSCYAQFIHDNYKEITKICTVQNTPDSSENSFDTFCSLCSFASFWKCLLSEKKVHVFPFPSGTLFQNVPIQVCILFIDNSPSSSVTGVFIRRLRWCEKNDAHYCEAIAPSVWCLVVGETRDLGLIVRGDRHSSVTQ